MEQYNINLKHISILSDKYDYICRLATRRFLLLEDNVAIVCENKVDMDNVYKAIDVITKDICNTTKKEIKIDTDNEYKITLSYDNVTLEIVHIKEYKTIDKNKVNNIMMVSLPFEENIESLKEFVYHFNKKTNFNVSYTSKINGALDYNIIRLFNKYKNNIELFDKKSQRYFEPFGKVKDNKFRRYLGTELLFFNSMYKYDNLPKDIKTTYYQNSSAIDFYIELFSSKEPSDDLLKKEYYKYYMERLMKDCDEQLKEGNLSHRIFIELYGIIFVSNKEIKKDKHVRYLLKKYKQQLKEPA